MGRFFLIIGVLILLMRSIRFFETLSEYLKKTKNKSDKKESPDNNFRRDEIQDGEFEEID